MNLFEQLQETIASTMNIPTSSVTIDSSADNLDEWESLAHVNLMMAIEQVFDIQLDVEDFIKLNSVKSIIAYLNEQGIQ